LLPALWLIILIVGFPLLSETVYTPSLPDIAHALSVSDSWVEYTLTIYLFGFALGTLIWGNLSDKWGRKPCLIAGLGIYLIGCLGCYLSDSIFWLMISRFIQAFGGSVGSVLGQAICRDAFHGPALGKVYASVGGALAVFPAIGPIIGGVIDQNFGWSAIFLFLIGFGSLVLGLTIRSLTETHTAEDRIHIPLKDTLLKMMGDRHVIGYGLLVAAGNGVMFSYFAEGPFFMIELQKLTPSQYGFTFIGIASAMLCSGLIGRKLHDSHSSRTLLSYGLITTLLGNLILLGAVLTPLSRHLMIETSVLAMMIIMSGIIMVTSNALSLSLMAYKKCIGAASSLFGFFYYSLVSLFTLGMGYLHNDTLIAMPIYFCSIAVFMIFINKMLLSQKA
jgi:Bcr/CflA subfamily drug resistance transporter